MYYYNKIIIFIQYYVNSIDILSISAGQPDPLAKAAPAPQTAEQRPAFARYFKKHLNILFLIGIISKSIISAPSM